MPSVLRPLPAFHDNYIWTLSRGGQALVVDPGDASVVEAWLAAERLSLAIILVTHHHRDHTGGVTELRARHDVRVFGPDEAIDGLDTILTGGERLSLPPFGEFQVMAVRGHTLGHIAYYQASEDLLFCGDTLFSAGCGRLFEGSAADLYRSLESLAALPDSTRICCTHEYTLANLRFAAAVEPGNRHQEAWAQEASALRRQGLPTLPVSLGRERTYNPFLRYREAAVVASASREAGHPLLPGQAVLTALRTWKDHFQ